MSVSRKAEPIVSGVYSLSPPKTVSGCTETHSAKHGAIPSCWAVLSVYFANPFTKMI